MSAAELKRLKASGGMWCFVDGCRIRRVSRIKELEAQPASTKKKKGGKKSEEAAEAAGDPAQD